MVDLADLSPSTTLGAVRNFLDQAHQVRGAGDIAQTDGDAIQAYRRASGLAENGALTAQNLTATLAQVQANLAGYAAAVASLAQSTTASVTDAGNAPTREGARVAADAALRSAEQAYTLSVTANENVEDPHRLSLGMWGWLLVLGGVAAVGGWWIHKHHVPVTPTPSERRRRALA